MSWLHVRLPFMFPSSPFLQSCSLFTVHGMESASEIFMDFFTCFTLFYSLRPKNASNYLFHFTFIKLFVIFYQLIQCYLIGYHRYCRRKDRRSFKLIVDEELRETTLRLSSDAFEE